MLTVARETPECKNTWPQLKNAIFTFLATIFAATFDVSASVPSYILIFAAALYQLLRDRDKYARHGASLSTAAERDSPRARL